MSSYVPPTTPIGQPPQGSAGPQMGYPGPPPAPKSRTWMWVLGGCGVVLVVGAIVFTIVAYFAIRKTKEMVNNAERNPAMVMAQIAVAANPDLETVSVDEGKGTITVRDRKTGEIVTVDFDDVKDGKIVIKGKDDEAVTFSARGGQDSGSLEVKTDKGSMKFGAGAAAEKVPDWVPSYPGAKAVGTYSMQGADGESGAFHFSTPDSVETVMAFYEEELKSDGLTVSTSSFKKNGSVSGGLVSGAEKSSKRAVQVTIGSEGEGTSVTVTFEAKH